MISSKNYNVATIGVDVKKNGEQTYNYFGLDQFLFGKVSRIQAVAHVFSTVFILKRN
jgi:hypothetical protein